MEKLEIAGTLLHKFDTEKVGKDGSFHKRRFIITMGDKYPQEIEFELVKDNCRILDNFETGDKLIISFDLRGNKWSPEGKPTKWFNSLIAYNIGYASIDVNSKRTSKTVVEKASYHEDLNEGSDQSDLPF